MTRYLISFPSVAMDHIPAEEFTAVVEAAHAVVQEAMDAGELRAEVDSVFPLTEARAAFERVGGRGKRGKVVLEVGTD